MIIGEALVQFKSDATATVNALKQVAGESENTKTSTLNLAGAVALGEAAYNGIKTAVSDTIGFFKDCVSSTAELAGETKSLQRETGMTAETASSLVAVFDRFGVSAGQSALAFKTFSKQMESAADPAKYDASVFGDLGIQLKDTNGVLRNSGDVLMDVADRFKSMPDGVQKTNEAVSLFGRAGLAMLPVLNKGSEGIKELELEAQKMGITLSQDNVDAVTKYVQSSKTMNEAIEGVKMKIGTALMPVFANMADKFSAWAQNPAVENEMKTLADKVGQIAKAVSDFFTNQAIPWVEKHWPEIKRVINDAWVVLKILVDLITGPVGIAFGAMIATILVVQKAMALWKDATIAFTIVQGILNGTLAISPIGWIALAVGALTIIVIEAIKHWSAITAAFKDAWNWISNLVDKHKTLFAIIAPGILVVVELVKHWGEVRDVLMDVVKWFEKVGSAIGKVAGSIGKDVKSVLKTLGLSDGGIVHLATGGVVYANDGFVPQGTDTVPAMLTPGEMVLNSAQQKRMFDMLNGKSNGKPAMNVTINMKDEGLSANQVVTLIARQFELSTQGAN